MGRGGDGRREEGRRGEGRRAHSLCRPPSSFFTIRTLGEMYRIFYTLLQSITICVKTVCEQAINILLKTPDVP